jgi:O-antigen ligase
MRSGFLFAIDVLVLYFVVSRFCTSRRAIVETMASFCLACAILAPLALFESLWRWLLYAGIAEEWGIPRFAYLFRSGILRAQVSTGHAIVLGNVMAIAFGFWLYLRSRVQSTPLTIAVAIWMWVGLLAAYSRGPWLAAAVIFLAFLAVGPNGSVRLFKALLISALIVGMVLVSPIGERVIDNLPFVGTVEAENITYRQRLAEMSWDLIWQHPFFGSPSAISNLEALRQGQGIIDLLNTFLTIAMHSGLVGLGLFVGFFFIGTWNVHRLVKRSAGTDHDLAMLGASLIAVMFGLLLIMAIGGYGMGAEKMSYVVAGLAAGYTQLGHLKEAARARPSLEPRHNPVGH